MGRKAPLDGWSERDRAYLRKSWGKKSPLDIACQLPHHTIHEVMAMAEHLGLVSAPVTKRKRRAAARRPAATSQTAPPAQSVAAVVEPELAAVTPAESEPPPQLLERSACDAESQECDPERESDLEPEALRSEVEPDPPHTRALPPVNEPNNRAAAIVHLARSAIAGLVAEGHDLRTAESIVSAIARQRVPGLRLVLNGAIVRWVADSN